MLFFSVLSIFFKVKVLITLPLTNGWIMVWVPSFFSIYCLYNITNSGFWLFYYWVSQSYYGGQCTISSHNQGCHIIECHISEVRFSTGMAHKGPQQRVNKSYPLWANTTQLEDVSYCKFDKPCAPTIIKIPKCDLLFSTTLLNWSNHYSIPS